MLRVRKMGSACSLTFALIASSIFSNIPPAGSQECNSDKGHAVCFTKEKTPQRNFARRGSMDATTESNDSKSSLEIQAENQRIEEEFRRKYNEVKDGLGQPMFTPKGDARQPGEAECLAEGRQPGKYARIREMPAGDEEVNYNSKTGSQHTANPTILKPSPPPTPKKPPRDLPPKKCSKRSRANSLTPISRPPN